MRALYVRTSVDDNDGAAQLHELRAAAAARGWAPYVVLVDRGESGAKASRPEWDKLIRAAREGELKALMCTELSRIGRSVVNVVMALDELHQAGVQVVLTRQGLDYGTPVGRAVATILAAVAQLERDQTRERIAAGLRRAKDNGTRSGKPVGRPERSVDIERATKLRTEGATWSAIARAMGVPVPTLRRKVLAHVADTEPT